MFLLREARMGECKLPSQHNFLVIKGDHQLNLKEYLDVYNLVFIAIKKESLVKFNVQTRPK